MGCIESSISLNECSVFFTVENRKWSYFSDRKPQRKIFYKEGGEDLGAFTIKPKIGIRVHHTCNTETLVVSEFKNLKNKKYVREHFPSLPAFQPHEFFYSPPEPGNYKVRVRFFSGKKELLDVSCFLRAFWK